MFKVVFNLDKLHERQEKFAEVQKIGAILVLTFVIVFGLLALTWIYTIVGYALLGLGLHINRAIAMLGLGLGLQLAL